MTKVTENGASLGNFKKIVYKYLEDEREYITNPVVENLDKYIEAFKNEMRKGNDDDNAESTLSEEIKEAPLMQVKSSERPKGGTC